MSTISSLTADRDHPPPRSSITDYPLEVQISILELSGMDMLAQALAIDTTIPYAPKANTVEALEIIAISSKGTPVAKAVEALETLVMMDPIWFHISMLVQTNRRNFELVMNHVRELRGKLSYSDLEGKEQLKDTFEWLKDAKQKLEQISAVIDEHLGDQDIESSDEEDVSDEGGGPCRCCDYSDEE